MCTAAQAAHLGLIACSNKSARSDLGGFIIRIEFSGEGWYDLVGKLEFEKVRTVIGTVVKVVVDRPLGTCHPKHKDICYSVNYGYIPGIIAPDGEEQDAYILGVREPVKEFVGNVIAIIHRFDDIEEKWVVAPEGISFTREEIMRQVAFQEQYFHTQIRM